LLPGSVKQADFVQPFVLFFLLLNAGANELFVGTNTGLPLAASRDARS